VGGVCTKRTVCEVGADSDQCTGHRMPRTAAPCRNHYSHATAPGRARPVSWRATVTSAPAHVQALRVLRAIKPLRVLTRSEGMRLVFASVTRSLGAVGNLTVLLVLFMLIFAILGVQLFSGKFHRWGEG
jgi:hypothetical protein